MSECVVRMEMPTKDRMCQMADDIDGVWYCPVMKKLCRQPDNGEMPSWCPIICSIPEGHGRLVDVTKIDFVMFTNEDSTFRCGWNNGVRSVMQHAENIVQAEAESKSPKPTDPFAYSLS